MADTVAEVIQSFFGDMEPSDRYHSWEHCYQYFHNLGRERAVSDQRRGAVELFSYLASFGMYRSGFLRKHDLTAHFPVIEALVSDRFSPLWAHEFGGHRRDQLVIPLILEAERAVRRAYQRFAGNSVATETLTTKVLMGVLGCLPAIDEFFTKGFKREGFQQPRVNQQFAEQLLDFSLHNFAHPPFGMPLVS